MQNTMQKTMEEEKGLKEMQTDQAAMQKKHQEDVKIMKLELKAKKAEASKVLQKLAAEESMLEATSKDKCLKKLPEVVMDKVKATLTQMKAASAECKAILNGMGGSTLSISHAEACQLAKTSALQRSFVEQLKTREMVQAMPA